MEIGHKDHALLRMHAIVHGNVQGVGFRATAQQFAQQLGLGGTVQNLSDGSVEIYAQGTKDLLEKLLDHLRQQNVGRISDISTTFSPFEGPAGEFKVIFR